jgi:hypothetical protein
MPIPVCPAQSSFLEVNPDFNFAVRKAESPYEMLKTKNVDGRNPWMVRTGMSIIATFFPPNDGRTIKSHLLIEDIMGRNAWFSRSGIPHDSHDPVTLLTWLNYDPVGISFCRRSEKPFYTVQNDESCEVTIAGRHYGTVYRSLAAREI